MQATVHALDGTMFPATGTTTTEHYVAHKGYDLKSVGYYKPVGNLYCITPTFRAKDGYEAWYDESFLHGTTAA